MSTPRQQNMLMEQVIAKEERVMMKRDAQLLALKQSRGVGGGSSLPNAAAAAATQTNNDDMEALRTSGVRGTYNFAEYNNKAPPSVTKDPDPASADLPPASDRGGGSRASCRSSQRSGQTGATSLLERRVQELEATLLDERQGRVHMQSQLSQMQSLLEQAVARAAASPHNSVARY